MGTRQYIGLRYVPKFADPVEWDNANAYEPLTIVLNQGNSYTSKINVPAGVDIANETYWVKTGDFNQQVASLQTQVNGYSADIADAKEASEQAEATASQANQAITVIGEWDASGKTYTLYRATANTVGGIKSAEAGNTTGYIVVDSDGYATVPVATTEGYGIVKPDGTTITVDNGVISAAAATKDVATNTELGQIKTMSSSSTTAGVSVNSSGAAYVPVCSSSQMGTCKPDGTSITSASGVLTAASSAPYQSETVTFNPGSTTQLPGTVTLEYIYQPGNSGMHPGYILVTMTLTSALETEKTYEASVYGKLTEPRESYHPEDKYIDWHGVVMHADNVVPVGYIGLTEDTDGEQYISFHTTNTISADTAYVAVIPTIFAATA